MNFGFVNKILPFSSVDGIGNRTVIFLQGCDFNCLYCHNPETISFCHNCGKCISSCKSVALSFVENKIVYNESNCTNCDNCLKTCNLNSSPKVKKLSVDDIFKIIDKTQNFISGITISGGECTVQFNFLKTILQEAQKRNIPAFIDTNANLDFEKMKLLSHSFDKSMIDIKWFDDAIHKKLTGKSNQIVLKNSDYLLKNNKVYEIRTVIFPYFDDNETNIRNIAKFISERYSTIRYKIINYRKNGVRNSEIYHELPENELYKFKEIAENEGCKNVIIV